jgi:hypothetical protein
MEGERRGGGGKEGQVIMGNGAVNAVCVAVQRMLPDVSDCTTYSKAASRMQREKTVVVPAKYFVYSLPAHNASGSLKPFQNARRVGGLRSMSLRTLDPTRWEVPRAVYRAHGTGTRPPCLPDQDRRAPIKVCIILYLFSLRLGVCKYWPEPASLV